MKFTSGAGKPLENERGIALVIAILLMMVITLFGALGITMSTRELRGAGGKRLDDQRFYQAQRALSDALFNPNALLPDDFLTEPLGTAFHEIDGNDLADGAKLADISIRNIQDTDPAMAAQFNLPVQAHRTEPPEGSGYSMGKFKAHRFCVTSTTLDGTTVIREGVWKVFSE